MRGENEKLVSVPPAPQAHSQIDTRGRYEGSWGRVSALDRWLAGRMLEGLGGPSVDLVLWNGESVSPPRGESVRRVRVRDRGAFYRLVANPELEFGELFTANRIDIEGELLPFLETVCRARVQAGRGGLTKAALRWLYRPRKNTLDRARQNIHQHYDIGNEFYQLWLDPQMAYTCAYYPTPDATLEVAQIAKMDHVCRKLCLQPGETVVEAGCGWGGLARHMAKHYGVTVKAYNISKQQVAYARERARKEGLEGRVEYFEADYRDITGRFDAFVSVGMLEHVGRTYFPELGGIIDRCLKPDGRGLIHSIGRDRPALMNAWIEKRIFSGAYPPSLGEMLTIFEPRRFAVLDVENLRLHYAKTLEHWLERYDLAVDRVTEMFDPAFVRAWRLYLAGSIATFTVGELQLFQVTFARHGNNRIPWTRAHLYEAGEA